MSAWNNRRGPEVPGELDGEGSADFAAWLGPLQEEYRRELPSDAESHSLAPTRRAGQVQRLAGLIRQVPLQRHRAAKRRQFGFFAAAAAILTLVGGAALTSFTSDNPVAVASAPVEPHRDASLRQVVGRVIATHADGRPELASADTQFSPGDEVITTGDAFASLEIGRSRVDLAGASALKLVKMQRFDQEFELSSGRVDLNIPKVTGESRFVAVRTADTLVTVRGTIFSVEVVRSEDRVSTVVQVTRGAVAVQSHGVEHLVHPGETWSSASGKGPQPLEASATPSAAPAPEAEAPGVGAPRGASEDATPSKSLARVAGVAPRTRSKDSAASSGAVVAQEHKPTAESSRSANSSLAEQNQLFARALEARDAGDEARARGLFEELLRRYPASPLRASALSERENLTRRLDHKAP